MKKYFKQLSIILLATIICLIVACQDKSELEKFRQAESLKTSNIESAKKFYKYLDAQKLDSLKAMLTDPSAKNIYFETADPIPYNDNMEPFIKMVYAAFPDYKHEIENYIASDDKVVAQVTYSGTFKNKFMDMNPNGVHFKYKGFHVFQFKDKKLINFWAVEDELAWMTQLGMELQPVKGKK